jgi:diguanylate cyclase
MAFAEIAFGQIKALHQPATPRNYEVWYTYATGYNPSLNQMVNETLAQNGTLTDADLELVYTTYISTTRFSDKIDSVGSRVMDEINQVMAMMDAAVGSASSYTESLTDATDKLGNSKDRESLRAIVESLGGDRQRDEAEQSRARATAPRVEGRDQSASGETSRLSAPKA